MPVSLSLYLYGLYQKKVEKAFDKNNKVLSQKEIEELFRKGNIQKTLQIFRSAVVDHKKIDGMPYHLGYPVNGVFYHGGFKRAIIADGITSYSRELNEEELSDTMLILDKLIDPETSISYARILAWNSLGRIGTKCPTISGLKIQVGEEIQHEYKGKIYNFFSTSGVDEFKKNPVKYIRILKSWKKVITKEKFKANDYSFKC